MAIHGTLSIKAYWTNTELALFDTYQHIAFVLSEASGTVLTPAIHGAGTIPTHLTSAGMISERTKAFLIQNGTLE